MKTSDFRRIIRTLRKNFPVSGSVEVRRLLMKGNPSPLGRAGFSGKYFKIHINSDQCSAVQYDTIMHEWAHVCAIDRAHSHDARWGEIYANIYDVIVEQLGITVEG